MNEVEKKEKIGLWRQRIGYGSSDFACNLIWQMIFFGVIGCLVFFFCFFNTKERVTIKQEEVSLKANISCLLHNGPWKLFALNILWFFGGYVIQASAVIFYFTYVVENTALVQIVATITTLVPIVTNLAAPFLVKLTSKRNLMVWGSFVHMAGLLLIFFGGTNVPVLVTGAVIAAAGKQYCKQLLSRLELHSCLPIKKIPIKQKLKLILYILQTNLLKYAVRRILKNAYFKR